MLKSFSRFFFFFLFSVSVFIQACGQVSQVSTPNQINPFANVIGNSLGFDVDPPFFDLDANGNQKGLDSALQGACGNAVLSWSSAHDLVSLNINIIYYIYQSLTPGGENFSAPTYQTVQLQTIQTNYLVQNLLPGTTYYFVVRARDEAGNLSVIDPTNLVEKSVTTQAPRVKTGAGPNLYCPGGYPQMTASWLSYAGDWANLTGSGLGSVPSILFSGPVSAPATVTSTGVQAAVPAGALSGLLTTTAGSTSDAFLSFPLPVNLSNSAASSSSPAIAVSGSNIATVWSDSDKGPLTANGIIYFSGSSDNGTTFSPPVQVSSPGRNSGDPSVAFGAAGNIYVVWTDFDISKNNNQDIYYSWSSTNGTSFSAPLNISWNGGISTSARVSSFGGNVSVVWKDDSVLYGLTSVWGSSSTDVYLAGKEERIYHSSDLGKSWTRQNYNQGGSLLSAIWGSSASDVYAAGGAGAILHTTGAPLWTWTAQTSGTTVNLNAVWGSSATDVYAVGAGGAILHTVNSGATWSPQTSNVTADLAGVWGSSASDVYAVGGAGTILYSVTAGANWTATQSLATTLNLNAIWGTGPSDIYIAADNGTIFHSTGNGVWSSAPANGGTVGLISQNLLSIWGATYTPSGTTNSVTVVYAGASGGKVIKKSGTAAWESNSVVIGGDFNVNGLWGVVTPTYTVIYGVQGDGPVMEWNNPSWDPLWPESTQGEIVYRQYPPAGPSYPLAAPVTLSNASKAVPPRTTASPEILPAGSSLWFSWTEGTAGTVGIVHDQSSLYLSVTSNGTAFSPPSTLLASPATGCSSFQIPKMAYDGIGTIYLVLQEAYRYDAAPAWKCLKHPLNFSQVLLASFTIPGAGLPGSLVGPSPISFSSGGAQSPVIAASGTTLAAGWIDTAQNKDDLYLITSPDGGLTFTPPVNFTSPFPPDLFVNNYYNSSSPFLLASGGSFYLGWTQDLWPVGILPGNNEIFFSRF